MMILPAKMEISRIVMWVKQCHKRPMIGNGNQTTYKDNDLGDGLWHCFTHIALTTSPVRPMMCNQVMCVNLAIERPHLLVLEFLSHLNFYLLIHDTYLRQYVCRVHWLMDHFTALTFHIRGRLGYEGIDPTWLTRWDKPHVLWKLWLLLELRQW